MRKFTLVAALTALPFALITGSASAEDAKEVVKYRQAEMGAMAKHMGAVKRLLDGSVDRKEDLPLHTRALLDLGKDIPGQYPEGTGPDAHPKTEALPKIWKDAEGFAKAAADYEAATTALHEAAEKRDLEAAGAAFEKVGEACGGCHDSFRKDD